MEQYAYQVIDKKLEALEIMISLKEYYQRLKDHDWMYYMSDDVRVYRKGEAEFKALLKLAQQSSAHEELFDKFEEYHRATLVSGVTAPTIPAEPKE